jgi:acetyltransferase-like isoleucine patch superfamily enzyme
LSQSFAHKVKNSDSPFFKALKRLAKAIIGASFPVPDFARPIFRLLFHTQLMIEMGWFWVTRVLFVEPLFRGRCESAGKGIVIGRMPYVVGPTKIYLGDGVSFFGKVNILSGFVLENPTLILKDRVDIGANVTFVVNREIVIEEDVNVASGVKFMDTDSHPRDAAARTADLGPPTDEIKPVRICRSAWIGENCFILKGVTIGEGAIIGVNSVVVSDIPPYAVAMGNPARVIVKDSRKPAA